MCVRAERFRAAAKAISAEFDLTLFGFDVIVPTVVSSHRHRHDANKSMGSQPYQIGDDHGFRDDPHNCVRSSSGACNGKKDISSGGTCLLLSQERGIIGSSSHYSDYGSIEEEIDAAAVAPLSEGGPCVTSPLDNFGGDNGHLVVIDVNFFPSYKEVPDFPQRLREFLRKKVGMV